MPEAVNDQEQKYLGRGWAFPLQLNVQGGIQLRSEAQKVRESIWLILRTELGERVYRPDFGSRLSELMFAPMSTDTLLEIRLYVREALEKWESRILLDRVITDADPVRGRVDIIITYRLKNYLDIHNFVYPFYLLTEEEE